MPFPVDPSRYVAFLSVTAAMAFAPGPANIFCMATGMEKGKRAALLGVVGLNSGTAVWFFGAAVGLSALVTAFPTFFHYLTYVGASYVAYLAFMSFHQAFAQRLAPILKIKLKKTSSLSQGFIVQITNPKAMLFFTAVLPPFMDVKLPIMPQLAVFAAATFAMDIISMSGYGLGGAALKKRAEDSRFRRGFALAVGLLLLTAAALIVVGS